MLNIRTNVTITRKNVILDCRSLYAIEIQMLFINDKLATIAMLFTLMKRVVVLKPEKGEHA